MWGDSRWDSVGDVWSTAGGTKMAMCGRTAGGTVLEMREGQQVGLYLRSVVE